jgi:hypothetical protein
LARGAVDYELVIYDELPPPATRGGGRSILNEQLETIQENGEAHGRPVRIGLYTQGTAATAAKNVLQQRYGRNPAVKGWKFYTRPVPKDTSPDSDTYRGLFAVYTPDQVVNGAWEAHQKAEEKRIADLKAAREAAIEEEEFEDEDEDEEETG